MSRELGLTQDWPVVIVGLGNLGQALANYGGFGDRGFPVAALFDADPRVDRHRGARHASCARSTSCPPIAAERSIAIGDHRHARRRPPRTSPTGWSPPACRRSSTSPPRCISVPERRVAAQGRPRRRAADPQLLPAAQGRRSARWPSPTERRARRRPAVPGEPARGGPAGAGRRRRRGGRREGSRACSPPARSCTSWRPRSRAEVRALDVTVGGAAVRARRGRRATASSSRAPTTRRSTRRCSTTARRPASGSTPPTTPRAAPTRSRPGSTAAGCSSRCRPRATARRWPSWLRDQLAEQLGPEYDTLLDLLAEARAEPGGGRARRPSAPIGDRPSIRGCWTSSGPVASTRPGSSSRPPSPPPIRPSRVPFARRPPRVRRRHRAEPPEHPARPARADDHR